MSRICILLALIVTAQAHAQPGKQVKLGLPQPESFENYHRAHCVAVAKRICICKVQADDTELFLVEKEGKTRH